MLGFIAKFYVLKAAVDAGMSWLAVAGVIASVIGAFYYLRIVYYMYFGEERDALDGSMSPVLWGMLMASAAIPGAFPPVNIKVEVDGQMYDEMHVDGGTTRNVFVAPFPVLYQAFDKFYPSPPLRRVFLLNNSKLSPEPEVVTPQTLSIAARAIYTLLKSQHHGEIAMIYNRAMESGADFNLAAVPDDFDVPGAPLGDPAYETALYETGMRIGGSAAPWLKAPPVIRARKA